MDFNKVTILVKKVKNSSNILAQATVIHDGVEIHGFTIANSQFCDNDLDAEIYIQPPRKRIGQNWVSIVYFNDIGLWRKLKIYIYEEYKSLVSQDETL